MKLYDRSVELQLRLEAAQSADASEDLLSRARQIVVTLDGATSSLNGARRFREDAGLLDSPELDQKSVSKAVTAFRSGLSSHGPPGLQHQPATNLLDAAKAEREKTTRWVKSRWKTVFGPYTPLIERAEGGLSGSATSTRSARSGAAALRAVINLDPVGDAEVLTSRLGGADAKAWIARVHELGSELKAALDVLDREHAALTPEVRRVLEMSTTEDGFPLADLTAELLEALRSAGVLDQLVVRR